MTSYADPQRLSLLQLVKHARKTLQGIEEDARGADLDALGRDPVDLLYDAAGKLQEARYLLLDARRKNVERKIDRLREGEP